MDSKKSSYFKFFRFSFFTLIFCVLLIGFFMTIISSEMYKREKFRDIEAAGDLFISEIKDEFEQNGTLESEKALRLSEIMKKNYNISVYFYNSAGNCLFASDLENHEQLSVQTMKSFDDDTFLDFDSKGISNKEPYILYGGKFFVKYNDSMLQKIYFEVYCTTEDINAFNAKLIIVYILSAAFCIAFARFILKKYQKKQDTLSLEFQRVIKQYSKGDFSEKINITSPGNLQDISKYVNAMAANMEKNDETSKTFIANVSHELRTPITTIGGFVDGILDGTIPKSRQQEYLVLVSKEIKRLRILISSMLNMSRFESGTLKPAFKETNLTDLVIQTVLMFEKKLTDKKIEIEGLDSERITAEVDADLIQQVIYNIVENAAKFVNESGTISFRFEKIDGLCTIGIKNTGEGLKNDEIQQVFDRFYKTDSSRGKDTTGLGLGLSISRKIVHIHNGHIIVRSVYGEYTEFSIQIPEKQKQ